jgi:murein DD-endopeptidase MepM/ murein hydrolase activator NlpD
MKTSSKEVALTVSVIALGLLSWWVSSSLMSHQQGTPGFSDAKAAPSMPTSGSPDPRFRFLSPWQLAATPTATRFDAPMGSAGSALVYNAQQFWDMNEARGGHHTGDDLNGIGGMNTDLGDPVFATADGLVVYADQPSPGWGNVVIVSHRTNKGEVIQSMYAHLLEIRVKPGVLVARGQKIATVGTANGYYPAHLHFEMRASDSIDVGAGYAANPLNHLDPMKTVAALRNASFEALSPSPLAVALKEK